MHTSLPIIFVISFVIWILIKKNPIQTKIKQLALFIGSIALTFFIFQWRYSPPSMAIDRYQNDTNRYVIQITESGEFRNGRWRARALIISETNGVKSPVSQLIEKINIFSSEENLYIDLSSVRKLPFTEAGTILIGELWTKKTLDLPESSYKNYLISERVYATAYITYTNKIQQLTKEKSYDHLYENFKNQLYEKYKKHSGAVSGGLAFALVTGDKSKIHREIKENFRTTGTYHILAVSGTHAAIIAAILVSFFRFLGFKKKSIFAVLVFVILPLYLILTDFQISIIRTYVMLLVGFLISITGRKTSPLHSFMFVFLTFIYIEPSLLFNVSFQLSFSAVFGILLALCFTKWYQITNPILLYVAISIGAQLATAPLVIYHFQYINYLTFFYNLFLSFTIHISLILAILLALSPNFLAIFIGGSMQTLNHFLIYVIDKTCIKLDSFTIEKGKNFDMCLGVGLLICTVIGLLIYFRRKIDFEKMEREKEDELKSL